MKAMQAYELVKPKMEKCCENKTKKANEKAEKVAKKKEAAEAAEAAQLMASRAKSTAFHCCTCERSFLAKFNYDTHSKVCREPGGCQR